MGLNCALHVYVFVSMQTDSLVGYQNPSNVAKKPPVAMTRVLVLCSHVWYGQPLVEAITSDVLARRSHFITSERVGATTDVVYHAALVPAKENIAKTVRVRDIVVEEGVLMHSRSED